MRFEWVDLFSIRQATAHLGETGLPAGLYRLAWQLFTYAHVIDSHVHTGYDSPRKQPYHSRLLWHCVWCTHLRWPNVRAPYSWICNRRDGQSFLYRPQFIEIYKRRQVTGISVTFLAIDICGAVFSLLSLIFKDKFDGIAALTYLGVVVSTDPCLAHVPVTIIQSPHIYSTNLDSLDMVRSRSLHEIWVSSIALHISVLTLLGPWPKRYLTE